MAHNFGSAAIDIELEQERRDQQYIDLSGEIAGATSSKSRRSAVEPDLNSDFDTLDEPVWDTIKRDLRTVGVKFGQVMAPKSSQQLLRDWDLWGPLFICVFISLMLQGGRSGKGPHFTELFTLTFFGSCVVTLNTKLLGGNISFFQSLCVLGYCLLPPGLAATPFLFALRLLVTTVGFSWAIYASMVFISSSQPPRRKMLALYPIFLFYFVVSWMIISHSSF
uniref:Protein YIPF n=1 Tax=Elaeophora elaphi TaxID=1147741 RepID=A0A158Q7Q7_9BILA